MVLVTKGIGNFDRQGIINLLQASPYPCLLTFCVLLIVIEQFFNAEDVCYYKFKESPGMFNPRTLEFSVLR